MRIAIVSPYSWTYAGGVNRHVEALADALIERGHEVRVLAPWDPPDRRSRAASPGARPSSGAAPTTWSRSGARSASAPTARCRTSPRSPDGVTTMRRELRAGRLRRRPRARAPGPAAGLGRVLVPRRSRRRHLPRLLDQAGAQHGSRTCSGRGGSSTSSSARIAVSEAAAWTGRRWFGGEYRVIPNGVDIDGAADRAKAALGGAAGAVRGRARRSARACRCCSRRSRG